MCYYNLGTKSYVVTMHSNKTLLAELLHSTIYILGFTELTFFENFSLATIT